MSGNQRRHSAKAAVAKTPVAEKPAVDQLFAQGVSHHMAGRMAEAEALYLAVLAVPPIQAETAYNLGLIYQTAKRLNEALLAYKTAILYKQDHVDAMCNMATALQDLDRRDEAIALYQKAIAIRPEFAMGYCNLGVALKEVERGDDSIAAYRRAIAIKPDYDWAYANLSAVQLHLGRVEESIASSRQAIALNHKMPMAYFNLGAAFKAENKLPEAELAFRDAMAVNPDFVEAHFTYSQVLLHQEKYEEGWDEYEWRWKLPQYVWLKNIHGDITQPFWRGEDISGKTLLVYAEQGLGDAIQYVRYIPLLIARTGAKIILAVHPPLKRLCQQLTDVTVTTLDMQFPPFDLHCPLLSLPRLFRTRADSIPADIPYLRADPAETEVWRKRIGGSGKRIGIIWAGNPTQTGDRLRSPRLAAVQPLFALPDTTFVALQLGAGRDDIARHPLPANVVDLGPEIKDLADTAAIMAGLDAVVTSCTAPLHLSGALGVKTWAMIPFAPHFLWFKGRTDNPWYPTLTLYHQDAPGSDWSRVIDQISDDIRRL